MGKTTVFLAFATLLLLVSVSLMMEKNALDVDETSKETKLSTFTSAVCKDGGEFINCKDEVFVNCNGKLLNSREIAECDGISIGLQDSTGFAIFERDWEDPRS